MKKSIIYILTATLLTFASTGSEIARAQNQQPLRIQESTTEVDAPAEQTSTDQVASEPAPIAASDDLNALSSDTLWSRANSAYIQNNYRQAIELYNAILARNEHSAKLYFNLGNAYFKENSLGRSILNYNRALLLEPEDEDAAYNLSLANARTVDKIDTVPEFFLKEWLCALAQSLGTNSWTWISIIALTIGFAATMLWLLAASMSRRKLGFYLGTVAMLIAFASTFFAHYQRSRILNSNEAVITNLMAPVKSSPDEGSKDIFVLHEGTKIRVGEELGGWSEITLSDGNKGWMLSSALERIN